MTKRNNEIIVFADLPPDPRDRAALREYKALGFTHCILTEDCVTLTENGNITDEYVAALQNIRDCGMGVIVRNMYNDADYFCNAREKSGSNYGTPYTLPARSIGGELGDVFGFYMADEPYMCPQSEMPWRYAHKDVGKFASFDSLVQLAAWKNKWYPDSFFHVNHVPSRCYDHYFPQGAHVCDYRDFLTAYTERVLDTLSGGGRSVCIDNYPFIEDNNIQSDYLYDLMTAATVTHAYNARRAAEEKAVFGMCVQTFRAHAIDGSQRSRDIVSDGEITFQLFVGAALGARLYEYFCYRSTSELNGILRTDGTRRLYSTVSSAYNRAFALCESVADFEWKGAFAVAGNVLCDNAQAFVAAKHMFASERHITVESEYDALIGCFENARDYGFFAVNYTDPMRAMRNKITICGALSGARLYGENGLSGDFDNGVSRAEFELSAGGAAFVRIPKENIT